MLTSSESDSASSELTAIEFVKLDFEQSELRIDILPLLIFVRAIFRFKWLLLILGAKYFELERLLVLMHDANG